MSVADNEIFNKIKAIYGENRTSSDDILRVLLADPQRGLTYRETYLRNAIARAIEQAATPLMPKDATALDAETAWLVTLRHVLEGAMRSTGEKAVDVVEEVFSRVGVYVVTVEEEVVSTTPYSDVNH